VPLAAVLDQRVLEHEAVYDALERVGGVTISRAHETLRPIVLDERTAHLLGVKPGSAAFQVERVTWAGRQPIEWQESIVRGDRYLYAVDLPRRRTTPPTQPGAHAATTADASDS
jgi:GntR family transcriptional regulator